MWAENPMRDEVFLAFWDVDGGRPGGRIIQCGNRVNIDGCGFGAGVG